MSRVHELKTWPLYFGAVKSGRKTFELRRDDRNFTVGDELQLREWDPETGRYTGDEVRVVVTYRTIAFMPSGYVALGIARKES